MTECRECAAFEKDVLRLEAELRQRREDYGILLERFGALGLRRDKAKATIDAVRGLPRYKATKTGSIEYAESGNLISASELDKELNEGDKS